MNKSEIDRFQQLVLGYYAQHGRSLPWRDNPSPYHVLVSEFMLQQTQVERVKEKYRAWIERWPSLTELAHATTAEVVGEWKGLGYNRRAVRLHDTAKRIMIEFNGEVPKTIEQLITLSGIGKNTAGAILAYAFNLPVIYIETNIRRVYIHSFFSDKDKISDQEILPYIEDSLGRMQPRIWYSALMDYGSNLSRTIVNPNRRSNHYSRQPRFEGSHRQLRGQILERLLVSPSSKEVLISTYPEFELTQVSRALDELMREGFLMYEGDSYTMKT
ncbi:MAG: A/G-specific adenine glycosylase [bacterium]